MPLTLPAHIQALDVILDGLQTNPDAGFKHPVFESLSIHDQGLVRAEITTVELDTIKTELYYLYEHTNHSQLVQSKLG